MMKIKYVVFVIVLGLLHSCRDSVSGEYESINEWVYEDLYDYYYWYNEIGEEAVPENTYPEDYFYSLLYTEEDKWSYITDDYEALNSELTGEPTSMGYSPAFGLIGTSDNVFMIIEYVYNDSPAELARLKRGMMVIHINGTQLNRDNYIDLYQSSNQVLNIAYIENGSFYDTGISVSMTAEVIQVNPVVYDTIFNINSIKVGYCVISEFISEDTFKDKVGETLLSFKASGINELIIDLRYNGGGYMGSAQWLTSAVGPQSAVSNHEILTVLEYSDKIGPMISSSDKSILFVDNEVDLNLDDIYFLTAHGSASASELTIIGLMPYMNVVMVGENTYGKYTGSWVIPDSNEPSTHNWAMMPIVMKYANSQGLSDFIDGLTPDYSIEDDLMDAQPFGDTNDPILAKALNLSAGFVISGNVKSSVLDQSYRRIYTPLQKAKQNLFFE